MALGQFIDLRLLAFSGFAAREHGLCVKYLCKETYETARSLVVHGHSNEGKLAKIMKK